MEWLICGSGCLRPFYRQPIQSIGLRAVWPKNSFPAAPAAICGMVLIAEKRKEKPKPICRIGSQVIEYGCLQGGRESQMFMSTVKGNDYERRKRYHRDS